MIVWRAVLVCPSSKRYIAFYASVSDFLEEVESGEVSFH